MKFSQSNDSILSVIQADLLMNLVAVFLLLIGSQASSKIPVGAGNSGPESGRQPGLALFVSKSRVRVGSSKSASLNDQEFAHWLSRYAATNAVKRPLVVIHHTEKEPAGSVFRLLSQLQRSLPEPKTQLTIIPQ